MTQPLQIHMFPCLNDNYGFLVHAAETGETAIIDTPEAAKIEAAAKEKGWSLTHIWNTHHHFDHAGGNEVLKAKYDLTVIGAEPDKARIPGLDIGVSDGDSFEFAGHEVQVMETPGHTIGHIIYYIPSAKAAFVGDTIFVAGCGRLFEGTPAQMYDSLAKIADLPDDTTLYCAHEYTLANGRFAVTAEPENDDLKAYMDEAAKMREAGQPTVPTTVAREKKINPFMRASTPEKLGEIRRAKDNF